MNTKLIRDSYRFEVWLPASLVSWLDARYPEDEPEVAIAKALKALQGRDRRASAPTIQVLHRPEYPPVSAPAPMAIELAAIEPQLDMQKMHVNPAPVAVEPAAIEPAPETTISIASVGSVVGDGAAIAWLNQFAQSRHIAMPDYRFEAIATGGFSCRVALLERSGVGVGVSKRQAKGTAARQLLEQLQKSDISI